MSLFNLNITQVKLSLSRYLSALVSFVMILFTARWGGAEVRGEIGLYVLNISLLVIVLNVFTGSGMVYLFKKSEFPHMPGFALWTGLILSVLLGTVFVFLYRYPFEESVFFVFTLIFQTIFNWRQQEFFATEKFDKINILILIQLMSQALIFPVLYFLFDLKVEACFYAAYMCSFLFPLFFAGRFLFSLEYPQNETRNYWKAAAANNGIIQVNTILGLLNIRAVYWFLASVSGVSTVGIFNIASSVIDLFLIYPKSGAAVFYAKLAGKENIQTEFGKMLKPEIPKLLLLSLVIAFIPSEFGTIFFGREFQLSFNFLPFMIPYFLFFAFNSYLIHYFSAFGNNLINFKANVFGLLLFLTGTVFFNFIPNYNSIFYMAILLAVSQLGILISLIKFFKK